MSQAQPPRSSTAPPQNIDVSSIHDPEGDLSSEPPSTLYARCSASVSRSLNARRLRQAADSDVQFLENRLAKLKMEEQRARGEIDKLRKKTDEVKHSHDRYDESLSKRHELQDEVDYGRRKEAALIALNKERQAKAVWSSKQRVMLDRREAVLTMRKQKEINECRIHILKEESRDKNTRRRETIRQLHSMAKERRERESEQRREAVRDYYEQRIQQEETEREQKERLAAQLVAQEAQMIYRLKKLHQQKQSSLRELASVIESERSEPRASRTAPGVTLPAVRASSTQNNESKNPPSENRTEAVDPK